MTTQRENDLLATNNRYVEDNRKLKAQLRKDREQFAYYVEQHTNKNTKDGYEKALTNQAFVINIDKVLSETSPR